jgi:RNA polymerase sigma-70 factor (ECF subfamily)
MAIDLPNSRLDQISTRWEAVRDPVRFVLRYAPAIQRFLGVLIKHPHDAEEVSQEFLTSVLRRGFPPQEDVHGRFRNYLIAAVRNAARMHFRRRALDTRDNAALDQLPAPGQTDPALDREWLDSWRQCLLDRVWEALERQQQRIPGSRAYVVLRLAAQHPDEDSESLAARTASSGRRLRPEAFRQQLSRARRRFARLLVAEVARTLAVPTPLAVQEELVDLGLMVYVRDVLPGKSLDPG